jgi:hypothetical protein
MRHAPAQHATKYVTRTSTKYCKQANSTNTMETHYAQVRHKRAHTRFTTSHRNKKYGGHPRPPPAIQLTKVPTKILLSKKDDQNATSNVSKFIFYKPQHLHILFQRLSSFLLRNNTKKEFPPRKRTAPPHTSVKNKKALFSLTPAATKFSCPTPEPNANTHDYFSLYTRNVHQLG